jgi:hypothetical protein
MPVVDGDGWKYGQGFSNRDLAMVVRRLMRNSSRDFSDVADFSSALTRIETIPALADDA